jgi:hypothetical protein
LTGEPHSGQRNGFRLAKYRIGAVIRNGNVNFGSWRWAWMVPCVAQVPVPDSVVVDIVLTSFSAR